MISFIEIIVGLAAGLAVGSGFVAFLTVLGIIPRLMQLSKTKSYLRFYEWAIILGAWAGVFFSFNDFLIPTPYLIEIYIGLLHGIFVGMLAAALTEVLNVFPILTRRLRMEKYLYAFVLAIVLGKISGSLFQWIIFVNK
ncbi:stage V sporulation protein AB [Halalkalibacillus halophilus]|uniref:stage V sporulation protein AB n=1 Tax=Halalkalibacillus halophilus TaxID=392827 RepID=UPI00047F8889|nr:stage V sporulation protein AB [Halalkalibacillus halophilus]